MMKFIIIFVVVEKMSNDYGIWFFFAVVEEKFITPIIYLQILLISVTELFLFLLLNIRFVVHVVLIVSLELAPPNDDGDRFQFQKSSTLNLWRIYIHCFLLLLYIQ